jgi:hypothetical protein
MSRPTSRPAARTTLSAGLVVSALLLAPGCGGGPPRRPEPPARAQAERAREVFEVRGARDTWDEPLPILHALKGLGGVKDAYVDEATGKYVVEYDPRRTSRDEIASCVREAGREQGRELDPIFDSR